MILSLARYDQILYDVLSPQAVFRRVVWLCFCIVPYIFCNFILIIFTTHCRPCEIITIYWITTLAICSSASPLPFRFCLKTLLYTNPLLQTSHTRTITYVICTDILFIWFPLLLHHIWSSPSGHLAVKSVSPWMGMRSWKYLSRPVVYPTELNWTYSCA